ncbi:MAG TPA: ABC transporter substrate-binding protein [Vineibacter sp.]|nr:ABC transporter substrate-binding protein [Vineibacter sp.]
MRRRSCLAAITAWVTLPAVAWSQGADGTGAQPAMISVTDLAGRQVKVRAPVKRVLLGEGRLLHLFAALDNKALLDRIAAWRNDMIQDDPASYRQYLAAFPKLAQIPRFGGNEGSIIDIERAIVQNLDAVILNIETKRSMEDAGYIEKLAALDIPTIYVDFRHDPVANTEPTIRLLGTLLGRQDRAEEIIAFRNEQLRRVSDVIAARAPQRPRVFIERMGGFTDDCCLSFGDGNFGRFVDMAGGSNIAKGLIPATFGQLNPEQVIAADPDHVIITSADWQAHVPGGHWIALGPGSDAAEARRKLAWFTARPAYTDIKAQKRRAFCGIWHQFYNSPYDFVAVQRLAKWFHPSLFADLDPDVTFRAFHERFLPVDYRPGYWVSLEEL